MSSKLNVFRIKGEHKDLTNEITIMCLERALKRIKSQLKHSETAKDSSWQIDICLEDYKIIKKAIKIIEKYN